MGMADKAQTQSPIACDMSVLSPEQREMHLGASRDLFSSLKQIQELPNGYEVRLDGPNVIVKAAEFIALEKLCCPFLNFSLEVEAENGPVWLKLTGREGVKAVALQWLREGVSLKIPEISAGTGSEFSS